MAQYIKYSIDDIEQDDDTKPIVEVFSDKVEGLAVNFIDNYVRLNGSSDLISRIKLNAKYLIYDKDTTKAIKTDLPVSTIVEVVNTPIGNYLVYVERKQLLAFVRTNVQQDEFDILIRNIEARPKYFNFIINTKNHLRLFGIFNPTHKEISADDYFITTGFNQENDYKIKYVFGSNIRSKIKRDNSKLKLLFSLYTAKISHQNTFKGYLENSEINVPIYFSLKGANMKDKNIVFNFAMKNKQSSKGNNSNFLFATRSKKISNTDSEIYVRKSINGQFIIVVSDYLEKSVYVKEFIGKVLSMIRNKKNRTVYFEKFAEGADESAYQLFEYAMDNKDKISEVNAYIMSKNNNKFTEVKTKYPKNVFAKNSVMAFYNIFKAKYFVSSDLASHIQRRLYDNSKWLKKSILNAEKIFLQHGPSLCTNVFARGYFSSKTLLSPNKIIVCSKKEKDLFLKNTFYHENQLLLTGFPNFDNYVRYRESNPVQESITFMLTWRPWDLTGEIESGSYLDRYMTFIEMIKTDSFFEKIKVNIILHPKAKMILENQFKKEYDKIEKYLYDKNIKDALMESSVVVTDYSSIMFYAFAGGSNMIYYWEDKLKAESEYGSPNIMQEPIAFGDIVYNLSDVVKYIKECYGNKQKEKYIEIYNDLVDCRYDDNTKKTFEALFLNNTKER